MARVKLVLEYDGTNYVGWQIQQNGTSVQGRVQRALQELTGHAISVHAAGRTDSGVHARGQVVSFDAPLSLPMKAWWMGLNTHLPEDIAVVKAEEVDPAFDPRRWSRGKRYVYRVSNRRSRSPLRRHSHWEIFLPLNVPAMQEAARQLIGEHDFSAFRASDCQAKGAVRELKRIELTGAAGDELTLVVEGTAFLKHMVRNLVGSLVEIGRSKQEPRWVAELLDSRDRTRAGPTAPPHGLCLDEVFYGQGPREDGEDDE
ncbi:MAG: tRNA pseudouridine(38-40) synthase TruA [Myxococcales bacterium]|nr:tRNA pseudouridine(38-40) synthase TruA [Myxococcales bacterium]